MAQASKIFCIYILTNCRNTVLYTGVTSNLKVRIWQHKNKVVEGFSKKYNLDKLAYYEVFGTNAQAAILREQEIKGWTRKKKFTLIVSKNPLLKDLYEEI